MYHLGGIVTNVHHLLYIEEFQTVWVQCDEFEFILKLAS